MMTGTTKESELDQLEVKEKTRQSTTPRCWDAHAKHKNKKTPSRGMAMYNKDSLKKIKTSKTGRSYVNNTKHIDVQNLLCQGAEARTKTARRLQCRAETITIGTIKN